MVEFLSINLPPQTWLLPWFRWASLNFLKQSDAQKLFFGLARGPDQAPKSSYRNLAHLISDQTSAFDLFEQRTCFKANVTYVRRTALHEACAYGALEEAQELVRYGADIEMPSKDDLYTPLHCACQRNRLKVRHFLL